MKEKILRAINQRELQLRNELSNKNRMDALFSEMQIKLAEITTNAIWTASLIKTSLTVTRTPLTTLKSILKANLNIKNGKTEMDSLYQSIDSESSDVSQRIPIQVMLMTQRTILK